MSEQVIAGFKSFGQFGVMHGHTIDGQRSAAVARGEALAVGENLRFNTTPILADGSVATGNDPRLKGKEWFKQDNDNNGKSPIIEYRWGSGGDEFSNSDNDPFHLNSYEDNAGCTPNLKLTRAIGPGVNEVWIEPFVRAEYNGGVDVVGPRITFKAD